MLLSLDRHLYCWTISHREYHSSSSQCYYHWIDTSAGGLLVTESIIGLVVNITITGSTPQLLDYQSQRVSSVQLSVLLPLDRHLCWWTVSHREYHPSSCQCYYHWIDTSAGELLVTESIIRPVVSVTITGSTPLLVDYQSQRVSSVLLSLDRHLCWWTISHREYHLPVQYHCQTPLLVDYQSQRVSSVQQSVFLSLDRHLCWWTISHREYHRPVVSVTITGSTPLLVDYQSQRVSSVQLSVLLPLDRHLCCWTVSHRDVIHPVVSVTTTGSTPLLVDYQSQRVSSSSCQCYYHWIDTSAGGLLVTESIIRPVVSVTITGSTPLLVDYQSQRVSSVQLSVLLPLDRHLCWWTISHREYHPSSCQCYYHWIDTSAGGLLVTESIIRPVVSVSITGSTPLLVDYQSQRVSSVQLSVLLPLDRHLCCWTISHREYHPSSCQCYYHWIDTSAGGLLVTESIIRPVVSVTITGSTPLLVDYQSQRVSSVQLSVLLPLDRHLCWWTISHREYHPSSSQCFYHWIDTSAGGLLVTESIIRPVVSVYYPLDRHLCWWTISHREYHPSSCQCYYHWIDTSAVGLLVTESIIRPVVSVTITGSTPLLVDYQSQRVSSVHTSVSVTTTGCQCLLPLDRHLCDTSAGGLLVTESIIRPVVSVTIHWIDTSAGGLLVTESIIHPVVSVTITGSTPLLLDYQSQRVSSSCQCLWIDTSAGGLLVTESIIRPVVSVTILWIDTSITG